MLITVHKCEITGELFEDEKKYKSHLRKMRYERNKASKRSDAINSFNEWLATEKEKITSVDMIVPWILENQRKLMDAVNVGLPVTYSPFYTKFYDTDEFTDLSFIYYEYSERISNTHTCPHNGVTNFFCSSDLPLGYPGYSGRIEGRFKREKKHMSGYPCSDILNLIRVMHRITVRGGNEDFGWGVSIFLDDWPGIKQQIIFNRLKYGSNAPGSY